MAEAQPKKKTSSLLMIFYLLLAGILLTVFLEVTDLADVAGKREHEQIIDRPHEYGEQ